MKEKLLFVTDESNQPLVMRLPRSEVHATLSHWHRTTNITIFNQKGELLCQQRSFEKDENPGKWTWHFGGHMEFGEETLHNAIREIGEEVGFDVSEHDLHFVFIRKTERLKHFTYCYLLEYKEEMGMPIGKDGEAIALEWIPITQLENPEFVQNFTSALAPEILDALRKQNITGL